MLLLSENAENTIVYNFGDPAVCVAIHSALKNEYQAPKEPSYKTILEISYFRADRIDSFHLASI